MIQLIWCIVLPFVCLALDNTLDSNWIQGILAHPDRQLKITIALKLEEDVHAALETKLYAVSDPTRETYGSYIDNEAITKLVAMPQKRIDTVMGFLKQNGFSSLQLSRNKDYVFGVASVKILCEMLHLEMYHYHHHEDMSISYIRSSVPYVVPGAIAEHVAFVHDIVEMPLMSTLNVEKKKEGGNYPSVVVPTQWRGEELYVLAALRCNDKSFRVKEKLCDNKIGQLLVSIDPEPVKLSATAKAFRPYELFDHPNPLCKPCHAYDANSYIRGQSARGLCKKMKQQLNAPKDTLFCLLSIQGGEIAAPSRINVATVFHPNGQNDASDHFHNIVSDESQCLEGLSLQNCSKSVILMPDVTPAYLRNLYAVPKDLIGSNPNNHQAVAAFLNEHYSNDDLDIFYKTFHIVPRKQVKVIGPNDPSKPTGEATLDVQTILGIASNISTDFWSLGGLRQDLLPSADSNQEPFLQWMLQYNAVDDNSAPLVHSVSYGDNELTQPKSFTDRVNIEFIKAGLLGRTILFAAGDDGCGGQILRTEGSSACTHFRPEFPSTSPYITSVGGTIMGRVDDNGNGKMEEVVSDVLSGSFITTGGGFSYRYAQPYYQTSAINRYLSMPNLPPSTFWNNKGRAYPDISAIATNYMIQLAPKGFVPIAGTSASTPAMAALISLLNDERLNNGLPQLGFINPLLYKLLETHPHVFNDVRFGSNKCSAVPESFCPFGFEATPGWDAASGVGTPNITSILNLIGRQHSPYISQQFSFRANAASEEKLYHFNWFIVAGLLAAVLASVKVYTTNSSRNNYATI